MIFKAEYDKSLYAIYLGCNAKMRQELKKIILDIPDSLIQDICFAASSEEAIHHDTLKNETIDNFDLYTYDEGFMLYKQSYRPEYDGYTTDWALGLKKFPHLTTLAKEELIYLGTFYSMQDYPNYSFHLTLTAEGPILVANGQVLAQLNYEQVPEKISSTTLFNLPKPTSKSRQLRRLFKPNYAPFIR